MYWGYSYKPRFRFLAILQPKMAIYLYFSVFGVGVVSELRLRYTDIITNPEKPENHKPTTIAVWSLKSTRLRGWWSSLVCVPWVCQLCQHASSVPACQRAIPEVTELPWMSLRFPDVPDVLKARTLCHCARWLRNSQDCTYGVFILEMMIFVLFYLSCDGLLAVGTVKESFTVY